MLRLIALFKLLKGIVLIALGLSVFHVFPVDVVELVTGWADHLNVNGQRPRIDAALSRLTAIDPRTLASVGTAAFAYGTLLLTEGVGLWLGKRWGEYLTVVATGVFIPLELYELWKRVTAPRLIVLAINVAIVVYLVRQLRAGRHHPARSRS
jgi:uncharacterized membrane protein (DUF2068 family)